MLKKLLILLLWLFAVFSVDAQNSTQGTEFWLSFMMNGYRYNDGSDWVYNGVMISAKRDCTGTITNPPALEGELPPLWKLHVSGKKLKLLRTRGTMISIR